MFKWTVLTRVTFADLKYNWQMILLISLYFVYSMKLFSWLSLEKVVEFDVRWFVIIRLPCCQCHDKVENLLTYVLLKLK